MNVLTDNATEFNAWMCVPFPLLGSMLHTPMLAFGYLCFTFSTHVVTLTIICSVSFLYCVTSFAILKLVLSKVYLPNKKVPKS